MSHDDTIQVCVDAMGLTAADLSPLVLEQLDVVAANAENTSDNLITDGDVIKAAESLERHGLPVQLKFLLTQMSFAELLMELSHIGQHKEHCMAAIEEVSDVGG